MERVPMRDAPPERAAPPVNRVKRTNPVLPERKRLQIVHLINTRDPERTTKDVLEDYTKSEYPDFWAANQKPVVHLATAYRWVRDIINFIL